METIPKRAIVKIDDDNEIEVCYFLHDTGINQDSKYINLTVCSDNNDIPKLTTIFPKSEIDNSEMLLGAVNKLVKDYKSI
jgi:hypothetical protein